MAHKEIKEYTAEEISNIAVGQSGFDIIGADTVQTVEAGVTAGYLDVKYWIALKAVDADAECTARVLAGVAGDDFSKTGSYDVGERLTIENGDTIYGVFDKINTVSSGDFIIAYRG